MSIFNIKLHKYNLCDIIHTLINLINAHILSKKTMGKLQIGLIAIILVFSLSGCSKGKTENTSMTPENQSINNQNSPSELPQSQEITNENPDKQIKTTENDKSNQNMDNMLKSLEDINFDDESSSLDTIEESEDSNGLDEIEE